MVAMRRWISPGSTMARSAARVPTMMSRSALARALLAQWLPWAPIIPMFSGWSVGRSPSPIMVLTTGMEHRSASSSSSSLASASHTPPPAQIRGCLEREMASTTRLICRSLPFTLGL